MAAESYGISLLGVMDRLWYQQVVLFSEPNSILATKTLRKITPNLPLSDHQSFTYQYSSMYSIPEEETFSMASSGSITNQHEDEISDKELDDIGKELALEERPTRRSRVRSQSLSSSSSPSTPIRQSRSKLKHYSSSVTRLQKTMSCKSLSELEEEEIKGFTDLGFSFDKQNICPRMMSVLPGLQRLGGTGRSDHNDPNDQESEKDDASIEEDQDDQHDDDDDDDEEKLERHEHQVLRPYLSEAWLIKRPDSPLLNLRIPRVSSATDMKKHLRFWARIVASEIHQESCEVNGS